MATECEVKDIFEMDWKVEQICHSGEVSMEPEQEQVEGTYQTFVLSVILVSFGLS